VASARAPGKAHNSLVGVQASMRLDKKAKTWGACGAGMDKGRWALGGAAEKLTGDSPQ